ncbi:hypothetical protein QN387_26300, partial [Pseudomonas sp. CCI3.1]
TYTQTKYVSYTNATLEGQDFNRPRSIPCPVTCNAGALVVMSTSLSLIHISEPTRLMRIS